MALGKLLGKYELFHEENMEPALVQLGVPHDKIPMMNENMTFKPTIEICSLAPEEDRNNDWVIKLCAPHKAIHEQRFRLNVPGEHEAPDGHHRVQSTFTLAGGDHHGHHHVRLVECQRVLGSDIQATTTRCLDHQDVLVVEFECEGIVGVRMYKRIPDGQQQQNHH